jgi:exopolysaccharide biosynthesis predicted pyruvyltransferase EpsI
MQPSSSQSTSATTPKTTGVGFFELFHKEVEFNRGIIYQYHDLRRIFLWPANALFQQKMLKTVFSRVFNNEKNH